jgi:hypothetical protein
MVTAGVYCASHLEPYYTHPVLELLPHYSYTPHSLVTNATSIIVQFHSCHSHFYSHSHCSLFTVRVTSWTTKSTYSYLPYPQCAVWLPITLICRICHNAQYRDTNRTLQYHYILAITPTPRTIAQDSSSHPPINTNGLPTAYTHLCHDAGCRDAYRTLQYHHTLAMTPLSLNSPCRDHHYQYRRPCYRIYALIP